MAMTRTG